MSKSRLELKVGLFVLLCLLLLAGLMLQFSKGTTFFRPTYTIILRAPNVGGLREKSSVYMSGVQVGTVSQILLAPSGSSVTIYLKIYKQYQIHRSARFAIEQFGFLGDQYIAIYPSGNEGPVFQPGDEATVSEPFNLQEVARNASGFIQRIDDTTKKLSDTIDDIRKRLLNEQTLTNLASTAATLKQVSDDALATVHNLDKLVVSNGAPASIAVSNLLTFSEQLNSFATSAQAILNTNAPQLSIAMGNVRDSTAALTNLIGGIQAGQGLAGTLLKNQQVSTDFSLLASNLAVTSSNLNRLGLWRVIRGVRPPEPAPQPVEHQGRTPVLK